MNIARSSLRLFTAKFGSSVIQFGAVVYFARELGAAPLGVFFLFQAVLGVLSIPADFGLRAAVNKRISEGDARGAFLSSAIGIKFVSVVISGAGVLLLAPYINDYVGAEVASYLAVGIALREFARLSLAVLEGELRVGETAELQLLKQVVWAGVGAILTMYGYGIQGLIYGLLSGLAVVSVWGWYKCSVTPARPTVAHVRSLLSYGKFIFIDSVGGYVYSWMDVVVIGFFLTQAHVGAYEVAWRVTSILMLLSWSIAKAIFPQVSQWEAANATGKIESLVHRTITPPLFLAIPASVGILVFSRQILGLVFGTEFEAAGIVLIVLAGGRIIQTFYFIFNRSLQAFNRPDLAMVARVFTIVVNLVLNVALVVKFGIVGAAVATVVSFVVNASLTAYYLSKFIPIQLPVTEIASITIASVAMGFAIGTLERLVPVDTIPVLAVMIVAGIVLYIAFAVAIPNLRASLRQNVERVVD